MMTCPIPSNEEKRIVALKELELLDTPPDGSFDRITQLAATLFDVPISIISLVDTDRIWFKSHYGLPVRQIDRAPGLCASAILSDDVYVVENARTDPRTLANPLVASDFGLQFYAAIPLRTEEHYNLGTLCIIDKQPRSFTEKEKMILEQLGGLVMDEMHKRLRIRNTLAHIRHLTADIEAELNDSIKALKTYPDHDKILTYMDATRLYVANLQEQLSDFN